MAGDRRWLDGVVSGSRNHGRRACCKGGRISCPNPAAGNGIFGCGDRPPNIATKMGERSQRQKSGNEWSEIPAETPYLASHRKRAVCKDCAPGLEPGTR